MRAQISPVHSGRLIIPLAAQCPFTRPTPPPHQRANSDVPKLRHQCSASRARSLPPAALPIRLVGTATTKGTSAHHQPPNVLPTTHEQNFLPCGALNQRAIPGAVGADYRDLGRIRQYGFHGCYHLSRQHVPTTSEMLDHFAGTDPGPSFDSSRTPCWASRTYRRVFQRVRDSDSTPCKQDSPCFCRKCPT